MSQDQNRIKVRLATEEQVNQEFIDAWHRAEQGALTTTEERLYFLNTKTLLEVNHSVVEPADNELRNE